MHRSDRIALALLATLAMLFFADVLAGTSDLHHRDLTRYFHPAKHVLRAIIQGGELPFWNPYFSGGQPMAANPEHEVFYPLNWLILLPDYDTGFRLLIVVHVVIALFGMYALLRSMELRAPAAFFGALSFGLGGICLSYTNLLPYLFAVSWLPLVCLYTRRHLLHRHRRDFALAALFLGLMLLIGEPTTILQTGALLGFYALYRRGPKAILTIALLTLTAMLVGAAQILPALDHFGDSVRARGFSFASVAEWSMPPIRPLEWIFPNLLGHITIGERVWFWGGAIYPGTGSPFLYSIYAGLLTIVLAIAGLCARMRGTRFVLFVVAFSIVLALGEHTPLLRWLHGAGLAASSRYPEKFLLLASCTLVVFAARVLDRLLDGDERARTLSMRVAAVITVISAAIALWSFAPPFGATFLAIWRQPETAGAHELLALVRRDWLVALARGVALLLLLVAFTRLRRALWLALLALFVIADLGPVMREITPRIPAAFFETPPPAVRELQGGGRLFHEAAWMRHTADARAYVRDSGRTYPMLREGLFPHIPARWGIPTVLERDYDRTALLPTTDLTEAMFEIAAKRADWQTPLEAMSGVAFRGVYRPFDGTYTRPVRFERVGPHPRYYFADEIVPVRDRRAFVDAVASGRHSLRAAYVGEPVKSTPGVVHRARETANTIALDVEARAEGFLVLSVTPHKYWRATIDGHPARLIVANVGYQGVVVPAGRHRVEMRYRNPLVIAGAVISLLAVLFLGVVVSTMRPLCKTPPQLRP